MTYKEFVKLSKSPAPQLGFNYLFRLISYPIAYFLFIFRPNPNQISVLCTIFTVAGGAVLALGYPIAGLLVFCFSYVFDFCDGNLARVYSRTNAGISSGKLGALLENLNSNIFNFAFLISFGTYLYYSEKNIMFLLVAFSLFAVKMLVRASYLHAHIVSSESPDAKDEPKKEVVYNEEGKLYKINYFLSKGLFAENFYLPIYLAAVLLAPFQIGIIFLAYSAIDMSYNLIRLTRVFLKAA